MSDTLTLVPTWSFAVQVYTEVLQSANANPDVKWQAVRDLLELARSYERLAVKLQEQTEEIDQLKSRIDRMLEKEADEEAKARIAAAQMELLEDSLDSRIGRPGEDSLVGRFGPRKPTLSCENGNDEPTKKASDTQFYRERFEDRS